MIELYEYKPYWGLLNTSPFCMKLEVYLKLAQIPYETRYINNPNQSPSKKLPFIRDGGKTFIDSSLIIDYLKITYGDTLDQKLTPLQQATALAVQRLIEEHLYWVLVYARWVEESNWGITRAEFFQDLPKILQRIVPFVLQKKIKKDLWRQGIGRLPRAKIYEAGVKDLTAVHELLGNKPFFLGDAPTSIDATVYAFLANIYYPPVTSPIQAYIKQTPALMDYCERVKKFIAG